MRPLQRERVRESEWNRTKGRYQRGMHIVGVVVHASGGGYLVRLDRTGSVVGFLRNAELLKAKQEGYVTDEHLLVGEPLTAAVAGYNDSMRSLVLSLEPLYRREAVERFQSFQIGAVVQGTVSGHVSGGVFLDVDGGGAAYMPISEVPLPEGLRNKPSEEIFHTGDRVRARVYSKDPEKRRLKLSISRLPGEGPSRTTSGSCSADGTARVTRDTPVSPEEEFGALTCGPKRRVLVVDDSDATTDMLVSLLCSLGHRAEAAGDLETAEQRLSSNGIDCIVADVWLSHGVRAMSRLLTFCRDDGPPKAIFMTAEYDSDSRKEIFANRRKVLDALLKPLAWGRLTHLIATMEPAQTYESEEHGGFYTDYTPKRLIPRDEGTVLRDAFESIVNEFPSCGVLLLQTKSGAREFDALYQTRLELSGFDLLLRDAKYDLKYSPIGDMMFQGVSFCESGLDFAHAKSFRDLLVEGATRFGAVLAEPVLIEDTPVFGFLVIGPPGCVFEDSERDAVARICERLSTQIETARALERMGQDQVRQTTGAMLLHEIGGQVCDLSLVRIVERDLEDTNMQAAKTHLVKAIAAVNNLGDTISFFRQMARRASTRDKGLKSVLHAIFESIRGQGEKAHIAMLIEVDPQLEKHRYPEAATRQIVINLLLNAIVQVRECGREGGRIQLMGRWNESSRDFPIELRVNDTANGMHADQTEHMIFRPYWTTREGGVGLGLYICRRLVESLGGTIVVEETWMYSGSTFLVRLPLRDGS